jgi:diguanylate cyclase (GGDEF)-like protein
MKESMSEFLPRDFTGTNGIAAHGNGANHPLFHFLQPPRRQEVESCLLGEKPLGLLLLEIENFLSFQKVYGEEISGYFLDLIERALEKAAKEILKNHNRLFIEKLEAGSFAVLFEQAYLDLDDMPDLAMSFRLFVRNSLNQESVQLTGQRLEISSGYALIRGHERADIEHLLYNGLCDAREIAKGVLDFKKLRLLEEFREIIEIPRLSVVYQPIMDFRSGEVLGWESLARGPGGSHFRSPVVLFDFAEEAGFLFSLEKVCREQAIGNVGEFSSKQKLFLNIHPRTLTDPHFSPGETLRLLQGYGLNPHNIVFEITERHSITEFTLFHRTLEHYRKQGYLVAIDDVGTGYSGLSSIAEIRPEFIKVDMSFIRGIDTNPVKRALLETLVAFADKIGCGIIAEGIETETEMSSLISMGVHYGQGYHLARPQHPKPSPALTIPDHIAFKTRQHGEWKCSIPVRELAEPAHQMSPTIEVKEVKQTLETGEPISGVVVVEQQRPVGLLMSHHLDRQLGTHYGMALYYRRSISHVMDASPLIVDGNTPVEVVAKAAMKRESFKIYDHIVVTQNGLFIGVVSVQKMLDTLARVQVEMAKGANPLTGLPGNLAIEQEMSRRCRTGIPTSLIYIDLDHFKAYNDHYGFKDGDKVLLLLSHILTWAARRHGTPDDFIGHVGGDDFVLITHPERSERIACSVVRCFKRLVRQCYCVEDRLRGFIRGKDRTGKESNLPLVSVSLAIVDCHGISDFEPVERRAAEMKHYAKSLPGNKYVRDRRSGIAPGEYEHSP